MNDEKSLKGYQSVTALASGFSSFHYAALITFFLVWAKKVSKAPNPAKVSIIQKINLQ
jgi:hypothetical protein